MKPYIANFGRAFLIYLICASLCVIFSTMNDINNSKEFIITNDFYITNQHGYWELIPPEMEKQSPTLNDDGSITI
jgi:hypothetical protein